MFFEAIVEVVFPVFLLVGVGWIFSRFRPLDILSLTDLLLFIALPALALHSLVQYRPQPADLGLVASAALLVMLACGGAGHLLAVRLGLPRRGMVLSTAFMNAGNFGMPLAALAYGDAGLALAVLYYLTGALAHGSFGIWVAQGDLSGWREIFRLPLPYAVVLGLALSWARLDVPTFLAAPLKMLADLAIPLMLVSLGVRLHGVRIRSLAGSGIAVAVRMFGGGLVAWLFVALLSPDPLTAKVIILSSTMPTAVMNFVFAQRYGADPDMVSASIALSTLASLVTVPTVLVMLE